MASKAVVDTLIAEAGGEGEDGLIAAAWAIRQRAAANGVSIDKVVRSGFDGFSNPGSGAVKAQGDPALRARVEQIMAGVESGSIPNPVPRADHFVSGSKTPSWASKMELVATIGGHRFYASGKVPDDAQGNSVGTQLDVKPPVSKYEYAKNGQPVDPGNGFLMSKTDPRYAEALRGSPTASEPAQRTPPVVPSRRPDTVAKSSAAITARPRQNMTPAADIGASIRSDAGSFITKDGKGVTSPVDYVLGPKMTTRLPQPVGQTYAGQERVAAPAVSASDRARGMSVPAPKPPSPPTAPVAPRSYTPAPAPQPPSPPKAPSASDKTRAAAVAPRAVTPVSTGKSASGNLASARSEQAMARGPAQTAVQAAAAIAGPSAAPKTAPRLNTPALAYVPGQPAPQTKAQVEKASGFRLKSPLADDEIVPGLAPVPAGMSAAIKAARAVVKKAPTPAVKAAPVVAPRKPAVVAPATSAAQAAARVVAATAGGGGSSGGSGSGSGGATTFLGTATGSTYVAGQSYVTGDGRTLRANNDGSFTNTSTGQTSVGSSKKK